MRRSAVSAIAAVAAYVIGFAAPSYGADFTMKIGFITRADQNEEWANWYKESVEKLSGGRIEAKIFPASQLGPAPRMLEGVQLGTVEAVLMPADFFVGLDARYGVFSIPALFRDFKHGAQTLADPALNAEILNIGDAKGLVGVTTFAYSVAHYLGKRPIRTLDDFRGKKFRVNATPAERERMRVLGATAVPMPLPEVIPALDRGTIDGTHSAMSVFVNFKFYDLAKTVTQTDDTLLVPVGVISKAWLSKLPPDLAKMVVDEGRKLQGRVQAASYGYEDEMQKRWRAAGGEVVRLPPADQTRLLQLLRPVGEEVTKSDPALSQFYKRVVDVAAKY
jgi:TRAP-type C4-dicarboxylate transport system substrate-binding protein